MTQKRIPGPTIDEIRALNDGYAESLLSEAEKRYLAMMNGLPPLNEKEAKMQKEIMQMMKEGKIVDIPSM